ncbi:MAG: flavin reductase family protein, partial [Proteobacteria bacterium]|nr:flavin reductase family protein [Pseudomonadota bacterium]
PTPVWLVGTYGEDGRPNVMTVAWGGMCCSKPPCVAVSLRKATHTYAGLVSRRAFTLNVPSTKFAAQADYCGMVSGKNTDKFAKAGLTPVKSELVDAPYVEEFPMVLECRLLHSLEIGLHTMFVGEILDVRVDEAALDDQGNPVMERVNPLVYAPEARTYHGVGPSMGAAFALGKGLMGKKSE